MQRTLSARLRPADVPLPGRDAYTSDYEASDSDSYQDEEQFEERTFGTFEQRRRASYPSNISTLSALPHTYDFEEEYDCDSDYGTCYSEAVTVWSTGTGTRTQNGATWHGAYTLNNASGFAGGAPYSANDKGVREGREDESAQYSVGRTGKGPAKIPAEMVRAIEQYLLGVKLDDDWQPGRPQYLNGPYGFHSDTTTVSDDFGPRPRNSRREAMPGFRQVGSALEGPSRRYMNLRDRINIDPSRLSARRSAQRVIRNNRDYDGGDGYHR